MIKGFTVVELVMVMVIIAVMSAMAIPRFFSAVTYNRQVYYDELLNSLRYARKLAVGQGLHIQVTVNSNSISLQQRIEGNTCITPTFLPIVDPVTRRAGYIRRAPSNIVLIVSSNWPIYFDGLGQAHRVSDCAIIVSESIGIQNGNSVSVTGNTGFVQ